MIGALLVAEAVPAHAQDQTPLPAAQPVRFQAWAPQASPAGLRSGFLNVAPKRQPGRNALVGGAIGAVAGLAACTVISNLVKDEGTGFSTCTLRGYLLFGGVGLALGLVVGLSV